MLAGVGARAMRALAAGCFGGVGVGTGSVLLSGVKNVQTMIGVELIILGVGTWLLIMSWRSS